MRPTLLFVTVLITYIARSFSACTEFLSLDIIFVVDSSGSVGQSDFNKQIEFAQSVVMDDALPPDIRFGFINFAGCPGDTDPDCNTTHTIITEFKLADFGNPNNLTLVFQGIGTIEWLRGNTWTKEAMQEALEEFNESSNSEREKAIILLTDGAPHPPDTHKACDTDTGFVSQPLQTLRTMGVHILTVGVDFDTATFDKYVECLDDGCIGGQCQVYDAPDFNGLNDLIQNITTVICSAPTPAPTEDTQSPTSVTPSPTTDTQSPTSNTPSPTAITLSPTSNTPSPTAVTLAPTSNTASPTANTQSPTSVTSAPTSVTPGPTTDTQSPTSVTSAPTSVTASPTTDTQSPTSVTASPTQTTPGPTQVTFSPTSVTSGPTAITPGPTAITPGPTAVTPGPTAMTASPTAITSAPTANTQSPTAVTPGPTSMTASPTTDTQPPTAITSIPTKSPTLNPTPIPTIYTYPPTLTPTRYTLQPTLSPTKYTLAPTRTPVDGQGVIITEEDTQVVVILDLGWILLLIILLSLCVICSFLLYLYYRWNKKNDTKQYTVTVPPVTPLVYPDTEVYPNIDDVKDESGGNVVKLTHPNYNKQSSHNMGNATMMEVIDTVTNKNKEYKFQPDGAIDIMIDEVDEIEETQSKNKKNKTYSYDSKLQLTYSIDSTRL